MKRKTQKTLFCLVMMLGLTVIAGARTGNGNGNGNAYGPVTQSLDAYFSGMTETGAFSGSVLVAREGKVLLQKGYGMANIEEGVANTPNTVFAIASMTKAFASMSIMMLEERGLLSVNDTVADHVPGFPNGDLITVHQLLRQNSGLFEYTNNPGVWVNMDRYHTPDQLLEYFMYEPLGFGPGTRFEYSNSNYVLLGLIVETVSGMTFRDFVRTHILAPLNMQHTSYDPHETDFPDKAVGYDAIDPAAPLRSVYLHPSVPFSAGAMYSSVRDLYRWDRALYTGKLVSPETLERMFTAGHGDYGYAWYSNRLDINGKTHKHIWHWGAYVGFHSFISRLVDDGITIVILQNVTCQTCVAEELHPLVRAAASIVLEN